MAHPLRQVWYDMIRRCHDPKNRSYQNYGARGIFVCDRWRLAPDGFRNFCEDMGSRPDGMTLDRKKNNKGYSPGNCRWATRQDQGNNQRDNHRITFRGKTQTVSQWAREAGLPWNCLLWRLRSGWSIERALTSPSKKGGGAARFTRAEAAAIKKSLDDGESIKSVVRRLKVAIHVVRKIHRGTYDPWKHSECG